MEGCLRAQLQRYCLPWGRVGPGREHGEAARGSKEFAVELFTWQPDLEAEVSDGTRNRYNLEGLPSVTHLC